jgi:hypothetical protein
MPARHQNYISNIRAATRKVWDGLNELKTAQQEWNALDYLNTLQPGEGENDGITPAMVGSVVFDTANALNATRSGGHDTNMARLL